jgi:hypothetical protein
MQFLFVSHRADGATTHERGLTRRLDAERRQHGNLGHAGKALGVGDYGGLVIDEIVAFLLVLFFTPTGLIWQLLAFFLFRLFDIWKPEPIRQDEGTVVRPLHGADNRRKGRARGSPSVGHCPAAVMEAPASSVRTLATPIPFPPGADR